MSSFKSLCSLDTLFSISLFFWLTLLLLPPILRVFTKILMSFYLVKLICIHLNHNRNFNCIFIIFNLNWIIFVLVTISSVLILRKTLTIFSVPLI